MKAQSKQVAPFLFTTMSNKVYKPLYKIFPFFKELHTENKDLKQENATLKRKLEEKQEHINQTNRFWKKKMHQLQS